MDTRLQSFRNLKPFDGYPVRDVAFNLKGDKMLVCTGSGSVKLYDRDGLQLFESKKGDGYLFDLSRTCGHVSIVNAGCWHPTNPDLFLTCSNDSTVSFVE
jgi:WD40 repeat protein